MGGGGGGGGGGGERGGGAEIEAYKDNYILQFV